MLRIRVLTMVGAVAAIGASVASADAGSLTRAWVSAHGTDVLTCGAPAAPCRTFQYVISSVIAPGGEIDVLDPGGYGPAIIPFALSIINDGVGTAGMQGASGQNAVTINAGLNDAVVLRGLTIQGQKAGANGVQLNSAGKLTISNSIVRDFVGNGLSIMPSVSASVSILDTIASDNGGAGIYIAPTGAFGNVTGTIDHVRANSNNSGIDISNTSGAAPDFAILNSTIAENKDHGIAVSNATGWSTTFINNTDVNNYGKYAIKGSGPRIYLTMRRVTATADHYSYASPPDAFVFDSSADSGITLSQCFAHGNNIGLNRINGVVVSFGDNGLTNNVTPIAGGLSGIVGYQ